jgi:hypothetical protein
VIQKFSFDLRLSTYGSVIQKFSCDLRLQQCSSLISGMQAINYHILCNQALLNGLDSDLDYWDASKELQALHSLVSTFPHTSTDDRYASNAVNAGARLKDSTLYREQYISACPD